MESELEKIHWICNVCAKKESCNHIMPANDDGMDIERSCNEYQKVIKSDFETLIEEQSDILKSIEKGFKEKQDKAKEMFLIASVIEVYEKGWTYEQYDKMVKIRAKSEMQKRNLNFYPITMLTREQVAYIHKLRSKK